MIRQAPLAAAVAAITALLIGFATAATASVEAVNFENARQESLYTDLLAELRCLVCANQSLSDSNADLAKDLRGKVRRMVADGRSRDAIVDYMVERYGEFVLYRPRFSASTFFLWVSPFVLALAGFGFVAALARRKSRQASPNLDADTDARLQKARALIEDERHW